MRTKTEILSGICLALSDGDRDHATAIAKSEYPFIRMRKSVRRYSAIQSTRVFLRDGFVDRYSGSRLVFPGALRLLSRILPDEFPLHPNWKMSESHVAYWELFPTIDHVVPVARGGADTELNWVSTSMLRNAAKGNSTIEELGWNLCPPGCRDDWDGLLAWFVDYLKAHPSHLSDPYVRRWHTAATQSAEEPNKAPEPTPGFVTLRAFSR